jgi:transposase
MSIPGVGPRTAEAVLAYTDDVERFAGGKEYCGYFGVTPGLDESGESSRLGHISKKGPSVVRWVLIESCWKVIRYNPSLREFAACCPAAAAILRRAFYCPFSCGRRSSQHAAFRLR